MEAPNANRSRVEPAGRRLSIGLISTGKDARRSWLLASFSLRSSAHVLKGAQIRSSRKPRQKPGLAGGQLPDQTNGQPPSCYLVHGQFCLKPPQKLLRGELRR